MYECKCGKKLDLTEKEWNEISENYNQYHHKQIKCSCGEILNVLIDPDIGEEGWFVSGLVFESDKK